MVVDGLGTACALLLLRRSWRGFDVVRQPGEAFQQALAGGGATRHDVPDLVFQHRQLQGLGNFLGFHGCTRETRAWPARHSAWGSMIRGALAQEARRTTQTHRYRCPACSQTPAAGYPSSLDRLRCDGAPVAPRPFE